eukprot:COSAG01_NODE_48744_length_378_cov_1.136201_1_plen_22_part_10
MCDSREVHWGMVQEVAPCRRSG